ncbi:MAG TPA: energy transducer TonB [Spirochaetota bacterium]|nr:energy transducer TonB [Spirochaetota bacterium]
MMTLKNIFYFMLFMLFFSCGSSFYQTRDNVSGNTEVLNYEYSNLYYSHKLKKEHFSLNIELNKPAVVTLSNIDFKPVERHSPVIGASLVRVTVDKNGRVINYSIVKYAGAGLDGYLESVIRSSKFRPVEHKEEPQECDFILKVVFRN